MPTLNPTRAVLAGLAAAGLALTLSGCSLLNFGGGGVTNPTDRPTTEATETAEGSVFDIKVGDCLAKPDGTQVSDITVIPCSNPHDYEVYAEMELKGSSLPSDADKQADDFCSKEFETFIGKPYADSSLSYTYFTPTSQSWDAGDKLISCMVQDPSGQTSGSLKGSNK